MRALYVCADEIADAIAGGRPVVALETTVVTHGLPHPDGVGATGALEHEIRQGGAIPATVGILRGAIRLGLTRAELNELATASDIVKVNLSNLAATVAAGRPGATTVAASMFAAHAKGIRVFVTGGIGGVHRDAGTSGDVSADLMALSRIPIAALGLGAGVLIANPIPASDELPAEVRHTGLAGSCQGTERGCERPGKSRPADE